MFFLFNRVIWLFVMSFILMFGLYFTFKLKGVQFKFFSMFKSVFSFSGDISSFGLLMTSLAGKVGVGSIAGVALSIYIGGPGTVFWMWVSTFFCAIITYCEVVLGVKYKIKKGNSFFGGPAYYIKNGIGSNLLGCIYSILIIICYAGCFLGIQSNTITKSVISVASFSPYIIGLCISCVTFFCIYGGFKRIVEVSEKLVPFMSLIYVASALVVLVLNFDKVGSVFFDIISSAFNVKSFFGGFIPIVITGFQRGIFSNEAGIGTSSIISSSDSCNDYRLRGFNQMFSIYITTLIICSATAIIILFSDYSLLNLNDVNGIEIASFAFNYHFGSIGIYILIISLILFSFSTIITGYYYGECCLNYFFDLINHRAIYILRFCILVILFFGCIISSGFLWNIVDIFVGIIVLINLYSLWKLRDEIE